MITVCQLYYKLTEAYTSTYHAVLLFFPTLLPVPQQLPMKDTLQGGKINGSRVTFDIFLSLSDIQTNSLIL